MRTKYSEPVIKVVIKDGFQHLELPNGEIIPKVVWTRVFDSCTDGSYVIAKILVNIGKEDSNHIISKSGSEVDMPGCLFDKKLS